MAKSKGHSIKDNNNNNRSALTSVSAGGQETCMCLV